MDTGYLNDCITLIELCQELARALETAREKLTEDEFEALYDSPFDEILCAAMDIEGHLESV
jgi:hypothetical protein